MYTNHRTSRIDLRAPLGESLTLGRKVGNSSRGAMSQSRCYVNQPPVDRRIQERSGNYLVPDPQYMTVNIAGNNQNSTYHPLNLQLTRRITNGFASRSTYIWSKALGDVGTSPDPNDRHLTKTLQAVDHKHQFSSNAR